MIQTVDIQESFFWLKDNEDFVVPYGITPRRFPDELFSNFTKSEWDDYEYNPPQYFKQYENPDSNASPKPTWEKLVDAWQKYSYQQTKNQITYILDQITTSRIALAYHPGADIKPEKEWQVRLSGKNTYEADQKRLHIIRRHKEIKAAIEETNDIKILERIKGILNTEILWFAKTMPYDFLKKE